jgi:acyl-CoA thioesterase
MDFQRLQAFFEHDEFARQNGIRLVEVRLGFARAELTVEPRHLNAVGTLQGGAFFTLADFAFAAASNSHGQVAVACQTDLTFFKAVRSGTLTATAEEISRTRRLSTCMIRVTDEQQNLVALFKGVAFIKDTPLDIM